MLGRFISGSVVLVVVAGFSLGSPPAWADCTDGYEFKKSIAKCKWNGCKSGWTQSDDKCFLDGPAAKVARPMKQVKNIFTGEVTGAVYDNCASNTQTPVDGYCYWCRGGKEIVALLSWTDQKKCRRFVSKGVYLDYNDLHKPNAPHYKANHSSSQSSSELTSGGGTAATGSGTGAVSGAGSTEPEIPVDPTEPVQVETPVDPAEQTQGQEATDGQKRRKGRKKDKNYQNLIDEGADN